MKIYLDTSSLFKLYHEEEGTEELENLFSQFQITHIYLSELTKVEFSSTIWKRVRTKEITVEQANVTLELFENDFAKYHFITTDSLILEQARILVTKYGIEGLRTLDSIQLSTCITLAKQVDAFYTADKLLQSLIEKEGLPIKIPNY
jgi:predicted nucleic acid-binding protein